MANDTQAKGVTFVLDTSYLVDCSQGQYWTMGSFHAITRPESRILIPSGVEAEIKRVILSETGSNGDPFGYLGRIAKKGEILVYEERLRGLLSQKLDENEDVWGIKHRPLSRTDKTIVQAAYDLASQGEIIEVVTADFAIVAQLEKISLEENLDIPVCSPWRKPVRQVSIDLLVSGFAFERLNEYCQSRKGSPYLAVARNAHVGSGVNYDVAFGLFIKRDIFTNRPEIANVSYIRVYTPPGRVEDYFQMACMDGFALYAPTDQGLGILRNKRPRKRHELERLRAEITRNRQYKGDDIQLFDPDKDLEVVEWARIEDDDIGRHDKVTVGKLSQLRHLLKGS